MQRRSVQLLLLCTLSSCGQQQPLTTIAGRSDERLIVVPVSVEGRRQWFAWDSGARSLVIDPRLAHELRLSAVTRDSVKGTGKGAVPMLHTRPIAMTVGTERYIAEDPWIIDLSGVPIAKDIRGLIGADLWSRYAVRMNSQRKTLELFRAGLYRPSSDEVALPLIARNNRMYVDARIEVKPGITVSERLRVDTGSGDSVNTPWAAKSDEVRRTLLGQGLGQNYEAVSGKMQAVHLGPFTVHDVWGPAGSPPSIGMEMLRRFVVTFDAQAGKMYLKPTPALADAVPPPGQ
jgi:hypothetical protein